ncbi:MULTISPECIES: SDR family NAD(P)-dependent oxidoreductase [unclassified Microbacterium]|jgi:NAD(P)-dependent dehydrogenase (short-subunit alcohol dehydrogenase family)|uniref:SDR family NAD(P)-dependent oxidoreductase n=1 Tax=unclassified Microbacterium TaxID=2609290 RepID=UPI000C2C9DB5|nr:MULTISPECIES: SDR family NAD(P)-dependent oxidoreductase [unclassified Microbacterium]
MSAPRDQWNPTSLPSQAGRVFLVTGSNAGLGYFASEQLARAGAHVVMSGRNPNRLAAARAAIGRRVPDASVETLLLDTSNLGSVRAAAASVGGRDRLDGVLLNAGIVHPPRTREVTGDGNELVLATNVLGHFALAGALLPVLERADTPARMVWLGSLSTAMGSYDPVDPQLEENYSPWRAYVQSKVIVQALGFEADRRLRSRGFAVRSLVAHPGYSVSGRTPGIRGVNEPTRGSRFVDNLQAAVTQSKERGAWAPLRALLDPDAEGGTFWGPKGGLKGIPRVARPAALTSDPERGARLWAFCEEVTAVQWPSYRKAPRRRSGR